RRSEVELMHGNLGDGVLTAEARAELPDHGPPVVRHALGDVDAALLLRVLPAELVPLHLARGHLHYQVDELAVDRPTSSAKVAVDADVIDAALSLSAGSIAVPEGRLSLRAEPTGGGLSIEGTVSLGAFHVDARQERIDAEDLTARIKTRNLTIDPASP